MTEIDIAILAWNNIDTIDECIGSVIDEFKDAGISWGIHVVDNGSTDGTQKYGTIKNEKNLGISKGKNQCIDACASKYIFLLDGDIIVVPNSIRLLLNYIKEYEEVKAIGFIAQQWSNQRNRNGQKHHETYCNSLHDVREEQRASIFYGIYDRGIFDNGLRFDEGGVFGEVGYGWEDHDFYEQMRSRGIKQYVAHVNHAGGKYYHAINSSIRAMGREEYIRTSKLRAEYFRSKWGA